MRTPVQSNASPVSDELESCVHMPGDEIRASIIQHYVQKFHDHGLQTSSVMETKAWVGGTSGATTRREKAEIWNRICTRQRTR